MAASTIPAAKAALKAALALRAGLSGISIEWGQDADLPDNDEFITIDDARSVFRAWSSFSEFEETYLLRVHVNTLEAGGTNESAETRLWQLVKEVEATVVADPTISGTVSDARPDSVEPLTGVFDQGWWAQAEVRFACRAFGSP